MPLEFQHTVCQKVLLFIMWHLACPATKQIMSDGMWKITQRGCVFQRFHSCNASVKISKNSLKYQTTENPISNYAYYANC